MHFLRRLRVLFRGSRLDREMDEEMRAHLEHEAEQNIARGMAPDEARCAARRAFSGVDQLQERERDARELRWIENSWRDFRYAIRTLRKSPAFAAVAIVSLALGIGASTAIFSVLNALLLRALPVRAPHELRLVNWTGLNPRTVNHTTMGMGRLRGGRTIDGSFPYPAFREFRERGGRAFTEVFALFPGNRFTAVTRSGAVTTSGLMVSGNFFSGYGADTLIGRPLSDEDDRPGSPLVAVMTYGMWERQFGLDPEVIGQTLTLNQNAFTIVGVLPRTFVGPLPGDMAEFYVSFAAQPALVPSRPLDSVDQWWVQIMARLAPGADERQAQAALTVLFRPVLDASRAKIDQPAIVFQDGAHGAALVMRENMAMPLFALLAVVGIVVSIACANVAGLLLARGAAREHEFAMRAAIGASRGRLISQALAESLLLGLAAGAGGLFLAGWGRTILRQSLVPMMESYRLDLRTDATVLVFTLGMALLTAFVFGLLPAWRASRVDPLRGLQSRSALAAPRQRLGKVLVAVQVGLSVLLVVGAGLMIRTFVNLVHVDPGFNSENLLFFRVDPRQAGYTGAALANFYDEARHSIASIPGVRSVALTSNPPASSSSISNAIEIPDRPPRPGESRMACELYVSDGYFSTLGIRLLLGREFSESDNDASPPIAVINETFARTFFPNENPIGRAFRLEYDKTRTFTIVGVSRDAKYSSIRQVVPPVMCFSSRQRDMGRMHFAIRSVLPPLSLVPAARKAIEALNPNLPLSAIRTQEQLVDQSVAQDRLFASLCGGLAALALLLACIGLYGLMAYNVTRRTSEIGVRMALGATRRRIAGPILGEALLLAGAGLAVGLPAALAIARLLKSQLYGVGAHDPIVIAAGVLVLLGVAIAAAWLPARRAARVDPMTALRAE